MGLRMVVMMVRAACRCDVLKEGEGNAKHKSERESRNGN